MIFLICGGFGSGKTTIVRRFLIEHDHTTVGFDPKDRPEVFHIPAFDMYVLGRYTLKTGGADTIQPFARIPELVREYMARGNVLFEGFIAGGIWNRWHDLSQEIGPGQFVWCFLDTPKLICLSRVYKRNNGKTINKQNTYDGYDGNQKLMAKAIRAGETVRILNYRQAYRQFLEVLSLAGVGVRA